MGSITYNRKKKGEESIFNPRKRKKKDNSEQHLDSNEESIPFQSQSVLGCQANERLTATGPYSAALLGTTNCYIAKCKTFKFNLSDLSETKSVGKAVTKLKVSEAELHERISPNL